MCLFGIRRFGGRHWSSAAPPPDDWRNRQLRHGFSHVLTYRAHNNRPTAPTSHARSRETGCFSFKGAHVSHPHGNRDFGGNFVFGNHFFFFLFSKSFFNYYFFTRIRTIIWDHIGSKIYNLFGVFRFYVSSVTKVWDYKKRTSVGKKIYVLKLKFNRGVNPWYSSFSRFLERSTGLSSVGRNRVYIPGWSGRNVVSEKNDRYVYISYRLNFTEETESAESPLEEYFSFLSSLSSSLLSLDTSRI